MTETAALTSDPGRRERLRHLLLILAAGLLVGLPYLGQEVDWAPREVRHALISAEMAERGEVLVPYLLNQRYIYKPPVMQIPTIGLIELFGGPSMALARTPSLLAGLVCAAALYFFGCYFYRPRVALLAALMLLASLGHLRLMRTVRPDMCFTAAIMASCALVVWGMSERGFLRRAGPCFLAGLCFGLANLSKGPYGFFYALFPVVIVAVAPFHRSDLKRPGVLEWIAVTLGFTVIPLAWIVPVYLRDNGAYLHEVFGQYDPSTEHLRGFFWYSICVVPLMLLPWTPLLFVFAGARILGRADDPVVGEGRRRLRAPLVVAVIALVALSAVGGKRDHYLGPWYPFILLELACEASRLWERAVWRHVLRAGIVLGLVSPILYFTFVHPVVLKKGANPDERWASAIVEHVPEGGTVICFRDLAEEVGWKARVLKWGRTPECLASTATAGFVRQVEETWRKGRPCYVVVRAKDFRDSIDQLANAKTELIEQRDLSVPELDLGLYKEDAKQESPSHLFRVTHQPFGEKVAASP
ncbi:MAG: phospholipid carrier-dependent glycosyltransferase [Planctomycetota bacterium]|nr:phospholipid carrier-dependent glycosyltransferase [Planctomycetota bacterium]